MRALSLLLLFLPWVEASDMKHAALLFFGQQGAPDERSAFLSEKSNIAMQNNVGSMFCGEQWEMDGQGLLVMSVYTRKCQDISLYIIVPGTFHMV